MRTVNKRRKEGDVKNIKISNYTHQKSRMVTSDGTTTSALILTLVLNWYKTSCK